MVVRPVAVLRAATVDVFPALVGMTIGELLAHVLFWGAQVCARSDPTGVLALRMCAANSALRMCAAKSADGSRTIWALCTGCIFRDDVRSGSCSPNPLVQRAAASSQPTLCSQALVGVGSPPVPFPAQMSQQRGSVSPIRSDGGQYFPTGHDYLVARALGHMLQARRSYTQLM
jgi:hypothetical protein